MTEGIDKSPGSNAAARLRRSISAARAAEAVEADELFAALDNDDDDSSLVLYRDPSRASAQSRGSVMSGAHEQGDTFFTALKKQPSWQSDSGSDVYSQARSKAAGSLCCAGSQVNPIQSVSNSAFFSAAGDDDGEGAEAEDSGLAGLGASVQCSYASALQGGEASASLEDGNDEAGGQLTTSVLNVIDSLYGAQQEAVPSSHAWQQQLTLQDQPLRDMPVAPAMQSAAAAGGEAGSFGSEGEEADTGLPDSRDDQQATVQQPEVQQEGPACSEDAEVASSSQTTEEDTQQEQQQVEEASSSTAADTPSAEESSAGSKAMLAAMDGMIAERSKLQQELSGYLQQLSSKEDGEGEPLVLMAEDYAVLVERMLREGRAKQYRALQGWEGPHRFEDLPVAQLRTTHKDPEVAAGLAQIAKLDEQLREASLKALVSARALNPEQYADAEKRRLEKRAAELDAALAKERDRRAHAAKLRGVLSKLDAQCSEASMQSLFRGGASLSYYKLKPQEEELLAAVLSRDDSALEAEDPFDPLLLNLDDPQDDSTYAGVTDQQGSQPDCQPVACQEPSGSSTGATAAAEGDSVSADAMMHPADTSVLTFMRTNSCGSVGTEGFYTPRGFSEGVSRLGSCLSGSVFSLMRPSSGRRGRRCSLAEIDAQLEAMQAERELAQQLKEGQAGLSRSSSHSKSSKTPICALSKQTSAGRTGSSGIPRSPADGSPSSMLPSRTSSFTGASKIPAAPSSAAATPPAAAAAAMAAGKGAGPVTAGSGGSSRQPRVSACSGVGSIGAAHQGSISGSGGGGSNSGSRRISAASSGGPGRSSSTVRTIDYIREQREVKELQQRELELDAQLRALQTSELPSKLTGQQLQVLLQSAY